MTIAAGLPAKEPFTVCPPSEIDGQVEIWDVATGKRTGAPSQLGPGALTDLDWSPDGRTIATVDWFGNVRLFDVETGRATGTPFTASMPPRLPKVPVYYHWRLMRYTPDGKHIVSTDVTGRAWVLPMTLEAWRHTACQVAGRSLTPAEWTKYLPGRPHTTLC